MAGFDFGRIGGTVARFMDTDFIDIRRDVGGKLQELYSNIPCHVAYASVDNPDPTTVDVRPVVQSLTVHCALWVDVRNNDFIVAKKTGSDGSLLAAYSGRCGNPVVSQGRKKVSVQMGGTEAETPTPLPPRERAEIRVEYVCGGEPVQDSAVLEAEVGGAFGMDAPVIEGYRAVECYVDGELQDSLSARIAEVTEGGHEVRFVYEVSESPDFFRFLANGLYTKDDGSLASGWHLYMKVGVDAVAMADGVYTIECADARLVHEDGGQLLSVEEGARLVLIPGNVFVSVTGIKARGGGRVTFTAVPFEPTEAERGAYVCGWYD